MWRSSNNNHRDKVALVRSIIAGTAMTVVVAGSTIALSRAAIAAPPESAACVLNPSGHAPDHSEKRSCLSVTAKLSAAPAVGERATLDFTVRSATQQDVSLVAELSPGLRWVVRPKGLARSGDQSMARYNKSSVETASGTAVMAAGQSLRYSGVVEAVAAGPAQIDVRASSEAKAAAPGADSVFLTVGKAKGSSRFGVPAKQRIGTARYTGTKPTSPFRPNLAKPVGRKLATPARQVARPAAGKQALFGTVCVTGTWNYTDKDGYGRPGISWQVQVYDRDPTWGDQLVATGYTGWSGEYYLCFTTGWRAPNVFVQFVADNGYWRVMEPIWGPYHFWSGVVPDVADGSTVDFGWLQPGSWIWMRGAAAFAATQVTWNNLPGACWDMVGPCRIVTINWAADSTDGTYYWPGDKAVHLAADDPNSAILVSHEVSHSIMDDVYDDNMPSAPNCLPHMIQFTSSAGCAWVEGFAEWVPATVFNDPAFRWADGSALDLEGPTWGNGWSEGDTTEGRVAGALIDLTDANNEGTDRLSEGIYNLWTTVQYHDSATFAQFWSDRSADGFDVGNDALGSLYQNTIDYGFVH